MRVAAGLVLIMLLVSCGKETVARTIPSYAPGPPIPGAAFVFTAEDGAHPVKVRSGEWAAPASEIIVGESDNVLKIDGESAGGGFDFIRIELRAPGGSPLDVGHYANARNRERFPDGPGMQVISNGLGCGDEFGEFAIDRIERSGNQVTGLDAGWVQSCGAADKPVFKGRVHFQKP